jgi:hypothetical protein
MSRTERFGNLLDSRPSLLLYHFTTPSLPQRIRSKRRNDSFHHEGREEHEAKRSNFPNSHVLRTTILENFRGSRKFSVELKYSNGELTRAKAQSTPSSERRDELSWRNNSPLFSDLCGLGVFARDIPSFGCGPAALGSSW